MLCYVGSFLIGVITALAGFPIFNFETRKFSLINFAILFVATLAWVIFYNIFIEKKI
jgi:hypothetical protein